MRYRKFYGDAGCFPAQNWRLTGAAGDNILPPVALNFLSFILSKVGEADMLVLPTLMYGSKGEPVVFLQTVLNMWTDSKLPPLTPDGAFGPLTQGKVREFQRLGALAVDGIVGPLTWKALEPWIRMVKANAPIPTDERAAGQRIVDMAREWMNQFGWIPNTPFNRGNPRIAAAHCADPSSPLRPRQGAMALLQIFAIAEVKGRSMVNCPSISQEAAFKWQIEDKPSRDWLNQNDLPAWCGIFAVAMMRMAGFDIPGGWHSHGEHLLAASRAYWDKTPPKVYRLIADKKEVFPGCFGILNPSGGAHHFIVISNANGLIESIDGNLACRRTESDPKRINEIKSTIGRHRYSYSELSGKQAQFFFPAQANR